MMHDRAREFDRVTHRSDSGIWWLHPGCVFGVSGLLIAIAAYVIPESIYKNYWRTPKFFDLTALEVSVACVAVFVFGTILSTHYVARLPWPASKSISEKIDWGVMTFFFRASFWLCLLGYAFWIGFAIQRGMTLSALLDVLAAEKGAMYDARYSYLATVGGVTTLAEFGIATMIFGAIIGCCRGWRSVWWKLVLIVGLALIRALVNSERFALIELFVPFFVAAVVFWYRGSSQVNGFVRFLVKFAPVIGASALLLLFTGFEYFRSWKNYYAGRDLDLWEFGAIRLLGYYVTSFNNGAYFLSHLEPLNAPYFTFHFLWNFPLSIPVVRRLFPNPLLDSNDKWFYFPFLDRDANLEFNNADGMMFPAMDFGIAGGLIYWLLIGVACGLVYALHRRREPLGLLLYPLIYLGVMEVPLALYWSEGRALPSECLLLGAPLLFWYFRRQFPARTRFQSGKIPLEAS